MRLISAIFFLLWAFPALAFPPGPIAFFQTNSCSAATPTHIQSAQNTYYPPASSTSVATFTNPVGVGHSVVGEITYDASGTISSITDNQGNDYTIPTNGTATDTADNQKTTQFYAIGLGSAPTTVTVNSDGGFLNTQMVIDEYSNVSSLDQSAIQYQAAPGTGTNDVTSGDVTTTKNGELIYASTTDGVSTNTFTAGTGFTLQQTDNAGGAGTVGQATESQVQETAGSIAGTFTVGTNDNFVTGVMTFVPSSCAPTSSYTFTGPSTQTVGVPGTYTLEASQNLGSDVTVTPVSNNGGTFSSSTVTLPSGSPTPETFTFTPANSGTNVLTVTNNDSLANPPGISVTASGGTVSAFFIAPSTASPPGNDSNACSITAPCLTLTKCQSEMESSSSVKTCYLRAGTYTGVSVSISPSDNGETWQTYPGDSVDSAVLDCDSVCFTLSQTAIDNFTINGLTLTGGNPANINTVNSTSTGNNITVENTDCGGIPSSANVAAPTGCLILDNATNITVENNYFHNAPGPCTWVGAFNAGETIQGFNISNNVYLDCVQTPSGDPGDLGALYMSMRSSGTQSCNVSNISGTISNNFIRDFGSSNATLDQNGIYLDDSTSCVQVTGNVVGAPAVGAITTGDRDNSAELFVNGGEYNVFTGNIVDVGNSAMQSILVTNSSSGAAPPGNAGTVMKGNIVLMDFTGSPQTEVGGSVVGTMYYQSAAASNYTITDNAYYNNAAGGTAWSNGNEANDANPQNYSLTQLGLSCTNGLYSVASGSTVTGSPVNFAPLIGGWGPPGFTIPASTNHSC